jgi:hypothetical protein
MIPLAHAARRKVDDNVDGLENLYKSGPQQSGVVEVFEVVPSAPEAPAPIEQGKTDAYNLDDLYRVPPTVPGTNPAAGRNKKNDKLGTKDLNRAEYRELRQGKDIAGGNLSKRERSSKDLTDSKSE